MSDEGIRYIPWESTKEQFKACHKCRQNGNAHFGVLMRRKIFEKDGEMNSEYKVVCPGCGGHTDAHRSKRIAIMEWEGKQQPSDGLKYRTRKPNGG